MEDTAEFVQCVEKQKGDNSFYNELMKVIFYY